MSKNKKRPEEERCPFCCKQTNMDQFRDSNDPNFKKVSNQVKAHPPADKRKKKK